MRVRRNGWDSHIYIITPEKSGGQNLLEKINMQW